MNTETEGLMIPTTYSRVLARVLGLQERSLGHLLQGTLLPNTILLPGDDSHMSVKQQMRVLENAQAMAGSEEFGLHFASQLHPSVHGPLGYLVLSSPDLLIAIESFNNFLPTRIPFAEVHLETNRSWLLCNMILKIEPEPKVKRVLQECYAGIMQAIVESVLGRPFTEGLIRLQHSKPAYHKLYQDYLRSKIKFGQSENLFQIPIKFARTLNVSGDPEAYARAQTQCQEIIDQLSNAQIDTVSRVQRFLLSNPMGSMTEEDVAQALFVSKRTLSRRLANEGTSYRAITEKLLSELAARNLQDHSLSIESIALMLGYYDAAAFRKAFKRWYGQSPSEYRQAHL